MNLLDIAKQFATNIGEETPTSVQGTEPFARLAVQFINETGRDMIRRVDWHSLRSTFGVEGDGTARMYDLATDHDRLTRGLSVYFGGSPLRGSLSQDEWVSLTPSEGTPRYFYAAGRSMGFYPYLAASAAASVSYQSKNWASDANGNGIDTMSSNTDETDLPSPLLVMGSVWRWYRHAGRDFSDHMAEYEQMLTDYAQAEGGIRQP
ncbi:MAG: phage adaptor protein [Mesorhizobium sp.]